MALDYLAFHRIVQLIQKELLQGKITKIYQISNEEFLFEIRNYGKNYHLLISTYPTMPYINLIENKPKTISIHTPLVLLLRKHLENGKIIVLSNKMMIASFFLKSHLLMNIFKIQRKNFMLN